VWQRKAGSNPQISLDVIFPATNSVNCFSSSHFSSLYWWGVTILDDSEHTFQGF
jgi:hypothetical protein